MEKRKISMDFVWIDGLCQHELRNAFGISEESLPNLVIYSKTKKIASRLVGKFNNQDVFELIEGVLRGLSDYYHVNEIEFNDRECKELQNKEIEKYDEIVEEVLKESKEKESSNTQQVGKKKHRKSNWRVNKNNDL